eukprot:258176_1
MAEQDNKEEKEEVVQVGWYKGGDTMTIKGNQIECDGQGPYKTGYSSQIASKGINIWKIKIVKRAFNIFIGIASTTDHCNGVFMGKYKNKDPYNAAYGSIATKVSNKTDYEKYGEEYDIGDIITINLNLNNLTISFAKNDKNLGVAFKDMQKIPYRLAVCLFGEKDTVEMISYVNQ